MGSLPLTGGIEHTHVEAGRAPAKTEAKRHLVTDIRVGRGDDVDVDARQARDGPHDADDEQCECEHSDRDDRFLAGCGARGDTVRTQGEQHDRREREVARTLVRERGRGGRAPVDRHGTNFTRPRVTVRVR